MKNMNYPKMLFLTVLVSIILIIPNTIAISDPLLYWALDETVGTNALESVNGLLNGTANTGTWVEGKINNGFQGFGDTTAYIDLPTVGQLGLSTSQQLSVSLWVKVNGSHPQTTFSMTRLQIGIDPSTEFACVGNFSFNYYDGGITKHICTNVTPIVNTWYHTVYIMDNVNDVQKVYINNVLSGSANHVSDVAWDSAQWTAIAYRGLNQPASYLNGTVDEVGLWNKTINESEVNTLYNNGNGKAYPFITINDTTPPNISIIMPTNNSIVDQNIWVNLTLSELGTCVLNITEFSEIVNNGTFFAYYENTLLNDNDYDLNIECNDTSMNSAFSMISFTKKVPFIEVFYPINNTEVRDISILINFTMGNFDPLNCTGYSNISGSFQQFDSIGNGLNQSGNYTLEFVTPIDIREDIILFVNCYNITNVNSSLLFIDYDNDFNPPIIDLIFPNSTYNDTYNVDLFINWTTSEISSCTMNDTNLSLVSDNGTFFSYDESILPNGFYSIGLNCTDLSGNSIIYHVSFTKDKLSPTITTSSPSEGNVSSFSSNIPLDLVSLLTDDISLYNVQVNITRRTTGILKYNLSTLISGSSYNLAKEIDISSFISGVYDMNIRVCDSHTSSKLKNKVTIIKEEDKLKYQFVDGVNIFIHSVGNKKSISTDSIKLEDRYSFIFQYDDPTSIKEYLLISNREIVYLPSSNYQGHFVIAGKYWVDFVTEGNVIVEQTEIEEGQINYKITLDNPDDIIIFESVGELNCNIEEYFFDITNPTEVTGNLSIDLGNMSHMILLFVLSLLWLGVWAIGLSLIHI